MVIATVLVIAVTAGAVVAWRLTHDAAAKPRAPEAGPVRVVAARAHSGDLPEYLDALGTVTALATVTVRSRVDGQLMKVAFTEGMTVREGDLLAEIDPRAFEVQLSQAKGQLVKDQANLQNAKIDLKRYEDAREAVPQQQIDTAAALVAQLDGAVAVDQAAIDNAQLQLSYCRITAPVGGRVGLRLVDPGNIIHANDQNGLVMIATVQPITVQFSIPQDDLPRVIKGMATGPLVAEAYDREFRTKLSAGLLLAIDSQIDPTSGTCRLKAQFANDDGSLFPNQFVNVRLLVNTQRGVILAPVAAVQKGAQGSFVFVVKPDETVEVRQVTPGISEGDTVVIAQGLTDGETVVTDGTDKLRAGSKVSAQLPGQTSQPAQATGDKPAGDKPPGTGRRQGRGKAGG
jgi:multidrug efflux system membrane fusion protein